MMQKLKPAQLSELAFEAIGTQWHISFQSESPDLLTDAIHELIENFDHVYSRFLDDSFVSNVARAAGTYTLPADAKPLLDLYRQLYVLTDGLVTPLIGNLLSDAGYDATYSLTPKPLRPVPTWDEALTYDYPSLTTHEPVLLDFGTAGKGYLIDRVAGLLNSYSANTYTINAGGDIYSSDQIQCALENPLDTTQAVGVATIQNQAICGSSGNRRAWKDFTHILDPVKRRSPTHLAGTWVVADTALLADGLATALYFAPPDVLLQSFHFEYALVTPAGELHASSHFPAEFFMKEPSL